MPDTDIKKALELLKEAQLLLKDSDCENLKISTTYLKESIDWLHQHKTDLGHKAR